MKYSTEVDYDPGSYELSGFGYDGACHTEICEHRAQGQVPAPWGLPLAGHVPHPPCASLSLSVQWYDDICSLFPTLLRKHGEIGYLESLKRSRWCAMGVVLVEYVPSSLIWCFLQFGNKWDWHKEGAHGAVILYETLPTGVIFNADWDSVTWVLDSRTNPHVQQPYKVWSP